MLAMEPPAFSLPELILVLVLVVIVVGPDNLIRRG
jgi:prepilin-type N-terminal cleavage/methylation domain-containing protein